jgi:Ni/Fe-hydrogenase subunit HybB-like protein
VEAAVNTWNSIAWFPICVGLTAAGLVLSYFIFRRRGVRPAIRVGAWSLVPLALYLTGSILLVGRIGSAVVQFAQSFVFSPKTWSGVVLLGLTVLILLVTGGIPLLTSSRRRAKKRELKKAGQGGQAGKAATTAGSAVALPASQGNRATVETRAPEPSKVRAGKRGKDSSDDDGLDPEIAAILRRRGIS